MGIIAVALKHMFAAGMTKSAIMQAVEELEFELSPELEEAPVTPGALRMRRFRERHKASPSVTSDASDVTSDVKENPPYPHKKNNISPTEAKTLQYPQTQKRGSRLPADWHPAESLWLWGKEKLGIDDAFLRFETGAFRDHFWAAPGQRGVKINWDSTWKNWMREAVRRRGRPNGHAPPRTKGSTLMDACEDRLRKIREQPLEPEPTQLLLENPRTQGRN